jgi:WD40 repeat protein
MTRDGGPGGVLPPGFEHVLHDGRGVMTSEHGRTGVGRSQGVQVGPGGVQVNSFNFPAGLRVDQGLGFPPPPPPQVAAQWTVARRHELEQVVAAVLAWHGGPVGITTGLLGAGGFGKTTLARQVCADERVRKRFTGGVYFVTIGREVRGPAAVALKVKDAVHFVTGQDVTYTDPDMAGDELGRLLDRHPDRRILLVLDDVWEPEQLDPFLRGAPECVRLVTTRVPAVLPGDATRVLVDQMTWDEARSVLCRELPPLPGQLTEQLVKATGRWPLLLRLANAVLSRQAKAGADPAKAAASLLRRLREKGPAALDGHYPVPGPDPADSRQRSTLVRATMRAAIDLLPAREQRCLAGLGIFAADEPIPVAVAAELWQAAEGLEEWDSRELCFNLNSRSLLDLAPGDGGTMVLHDVIRDYLRHELGGERIAELNAILADAVAARLSPAAPLAPSAPGPQAAWWALAEGGNPGDSYLASHAIAHLMAAGRTRQAEAVAFDLRWVEARLRQQGPAAPWSDCNRIPTQAAASRARDLAQAAHLLARTGPGHALVTVLHSRLGPLAAWRDQVTARQAQFFRPALRDLWPPPDLPHPALVRVIPGHHTRVRDVVIAPDSTWLATMHENGMVRIWDKATGAQTAALAGHGMGVRKVVIAPDSTWLATTDGKGKARIWDPVTGRRTATLAGRVTAVVIAPDSTWLAATSDDGTVGIWDNAAGAQTAALAGHDTGVRKVVIAPDSTWLASTHENGTACIWDKAGAQITALSSHDGTLRDLVIASDASWVATVGDDGTVRVWDPVTGTQTTLTTGAAAAAVALDGGRLATSGEDGTVRIWDIAAGVQTAALTSRDGRRLRNLALASDGGWFAATGPRGELRIWDPVTGTETGAPRTSQVTAVVIAPDGKWLTSAHENGTACIWDKADGTQTALTGHNSQLRRMVIAPDSNWLATTDYDGTVRIWDKAGDARATARTARNRSVRQLAIAPDSTWAATAYENGPVRIWDRADGTETTLTSSPPRDLLIAPDSSWLATSHRDGAVRIWDRADGTETVLPDHGNRLRNIAIAPDSSWLAITHENPWSSARGEIRIWNRTAGTETTLTGHDWLRKIAIASDSGWLAAAYHDGTVRIWDPAAGTQAATLVSRDKRLHSLAIAPDGTWLAASHVNGTVCIWDIAAGTRSAALAGHYDQAREVTIAPDSSWLVITKANGEAQVWDKTTGTQTTITSRSNRLHNLNIAPGSNWLAFTDHDGTACIWDKPTGTRTALPGHNPDARSVTIAPDSSWLATSHENGTVCIWDIAAGTRTILTRQTTAVAIAPDSNRLATTHENGEVRIWDKASQQPLTMMRTDGILQSPTWMPDGTGLVVEGNQGPYLYEFYPGRRAETMHIV